MPYSPAQGGWVCQSKALTDLLIHEVDACQNADDVERSAEFHMSQAMKDSERIEALEREHNELL